ncbi:MAG: DUF4249 domain-containing protein [Chitinophagaceae bacterium]|nr:DUF4249 domain-containing protein [Chitinophagaceae bacterium]
MKKWFFCFIFLMGFGSCEKNIDIKPDATNTKLVVDAQIENDQAPTVVLSSSFGYFSTIDSTILNNSFIHDAVLTISDGTKTHQLKEYKVATAGGYFYYFSSDPANPATYMKGELGKSYTLKIVYKNQSYSAITSIPFLTKLIDSVWWQSLKNYPDAPQVVLMAKVTDPPGLGNYIRYFTKENSEPFFPGLNSVFDDQVVDGKTYTIQVDKGVDRNQPINRANYGYFYRGDTAVIKFCNIDKESFDFWKTWEYAFQSIGNPFSAPGKVIGNVDNSALGAFCGYSVQYKTLIIPK